MAAVMGEADWWTTQAQTELRTALQLKYLGVAVVSACWLHAGRIHASLRKGVDEWLVGVFRLTPCHCFQD